MNAYQQSLKIKRDNFVHDQNVLKQGLEQGLIQGEHKKSLEIAKNLKGLGMSIDHIVKATGLSITEIKAL